MDCRECDYWLCAVCCPPEPSLPWEGMSSLSDSVAGVPLFKGVGSTALDLVMARAERLRRKTEEDLKCEAQKAEALDLEGRGGVSSGVAITSGAAPLLPETVTDSVAQLVQFPGPRSVCQRWRLALDWHWCLELAWALQWREHLWLAGDALVKWKHRTDIEMSAFFDRRSYTFKFGQDHAYDARWAWTFGDDFGIDYAVECLDSGRWSLDGCRLILRSGSKSPQRIAEFLEGCRQPTCAKIIAADRYAWLPLAEVFCGQTSSTWASPWENEVKHMAVPEGKSSESSPRLPPDLFS